MHKYSKFIGIAFAAGLISACSDLSAKAEKPYKDMTVAEQAAEMERYVAAFNALPQFAAKNQGKNLAVKHHGDPNTHIIYAVATYPKHVSAKQLANVKTTLTKIKAKENICAQPEMVVLTSTGIGYQAIMQDPSGKILYKSDVCRGDPCQSAI